MIRHRHRRVTDASREKLDKISCNRSVAETNIEGQYEQYQYRHWIVDLIRICLLGITRLLQSCFDLFHIEAADAGRSNIHGRARPDSWNQLVRDAVRNQKVLDALAIVLRPIKVARDTVVGSDCDW